MGFCLCWSSLKTTSMSSNLANRQLKNLEKAGLHLWLFNDLRHTFASLLLTNGAPIAYVSEEMGHASIQLTVKLYGHLQRRLRPIGFVASSGGIGILLVILG